MYELVPATPLRKNTPSGEKTRANYRTQTTPVPMGVQIGRTLESSQHPPHELSRD